MNWTSLFRSAALNFPIRTNIQGVKRVKSLLEIGADWNIRNNSGRSSLETALINERIEIVKILILHTH